MRIVSSEELGGTLLGKPPGCDFIGETMNFEN
jgi:hypothetical protein